MTGCEIIELSNTLLNQVRSDYSSLVTVPETEEEVVICSGYDSTCESFDGSNSISLSNTKVKHDFACMALYDNQATIIAGQQTNSVEELYISGWRDQPSHPVSGTTYYFYSHACVSVNNGIITVGGYDGSNYIKDVYLFQKQEWTVVGQLKEVEN